MYVYISSNLAYYFLNLEFTDGCTNVHQFQFSVSLFRISVSWWWMYFSSNLAYCFTDLELFDVWWTSVLILHIGFIIKFQVAKDYYQMRYFLYCLQLVSRKDFGFRSEKYLKNYSVHFRNIWNNLEQDIY